MKTIFFAFIALIMGCAPAVKPLYLKPLPPSDFHKKMIMINVSPSEMYQSSCTGELSGQLFQQQDGHWIEVLNHFDPSNSHTAYYLDGKFSKKTMWGEGCDLYECKKVSSTIRLDLAKFQTLDEMPNPLYTKNPNDEQKMIPSYKTILLKGHFKTTYEYYTDSNCTEGSNQKREIEFDVNE